MRNINMNHYRTPRTMQQAFGPYALLEVSKRRRFNGWHLTCAAVVVVVGLMLAAHIIARFA